MVKTLYGIWDLKTCMFATGCFLYYFTETKLQHHKCYKRVEWLNKNIYIQRVYRKHQAYKS